jgi:phosphate transport system protein
VSNRQLFHTELDQVRREIVMLAALATETIPRGTEILLAGDLVGAQRLIEEDDAIDALAVGIEDRCNHLLTLQQPVASDLRAIVTALRLTAELERSADLMVNVAKSARRMYGATLNPALRGLIERMSEEATRLFRLAVDAYSEGNAALASALGDMDDRLDELSTTFIQAIFDAHREPDGLDLQVCVQLALIGRYYERIGDHAVNIAERVQYMVTGWRAAENGAARVPFRTQQARDRLIEETEPRHPGGISVAEPLDEEPLGEVDE